MRQWKKWSEESGKTKGLAPKTSAQALQGGYKKRLVPYANSAFAEVAVSETPSDRF